MPAHMRGLRPLLAALAAASAAICPTAGSIAQRAAATPTTLAAVATAAMLAADPVASASPEPSTNPIVAAAVPAAPTFPTT